MNIALSRITIGFTLFLFVSCLNTVSPNSEMIQLLADVNRKNYSHENPFCSDARMRHFDSIYLNASQFSDIAFAEFQVANALLEAGKEQKAVTYLEDLLTKTQQDVSNRAVVMKQLALTHLRIGERTNCVLDHSGESCIFPLKGRGIHQDKIGSEKAIEIYETLLKAFPDDLESKWLLNIAYMTTGEYPHKVPSGFLIPGLDADTSTLVKPFIDVAIGVGLNTNNLAGGSIVDDFNNDGYLDIITSSWSLTQGMHYCRNNTNGTFTDVSDSSGLGHLMGGLNMMQTDYNNDGFKDIFVTRGGWMRQYGQQPNSLLKNNGNGTFTDVTKEVGLLSFRPTQTATWADFNNDGWLDLFIGNETTTDNIYPCELYINNKGVFTEVAEKAGCNIKQFVKGVTSGDYDNDGMTDIFVSTQNGRSYLFKNETVKNGTLKFKDVTEQANLHLIKSRTFPTWFWDYDNDGWLDILICDYDYTASLAWYSAAEALGKPIGNSGTVFLFRNKHDGTFEDVSKKLGLNRVAFAMGSNFGDIDNDGYLDIYLGTGNPVYQSLVPNKMFKNLGGEKFADITTTARVGNLQKGHGVSFADLDNDGDQDIHIDMGGAYDGDAYENSLFINPGQSNNRWIDISLEGVKSNKAAIGVKIKVTFKENGITRSVYRDVNSGGSFGANPLKQHIGIGQATVVESIEIKWPTSNIVQVFNNIPAGESIKITEGSNAVTKSKFRVADFTATRSGIISCGK